MAKQKKQTSEAAVPRWELRRCRAGRQRRVADRAPVRHQSGHDGLSGPAPQEGAEHRLRRRPARHRGRNRHRPHPLLEGKGDLRHRDGPDRSRARPLRPPSRPRDDESGDRERRPRREREGAARTSQLPSAEANAGDQLRPRASPQHLEARRSAPTSPQLSIQADEGTRGELSLDESRGCVMRPGARARQSGAEWLRRRSSERPPVASPALAASPRARPRAGADSRQADRWRPAGPGTPRLRACRFYG